VSGRRRFLEDAGQHHEELRGNGCWGENWGGSVGVWKAFRDQKVMKKMRGRAGKWGLKLIWREAVSYRGKVSKRKGG